MDEDTQKNNNYRIETDDASSDDVPNTLRRETASVKSVGPLIGTIIIVIVLLIGGFYFLNTKVDELEDSELLPTLQSGGETEAVVNQLESQGTSDEIGAIEEDLSATDLEGLDTELDQILNEL